ncbi:IS1595 family transposase [uncultured Bacteroides sp.]|uniref:IS1595 family transposase n=1 Tax=uncultured Bacteroides sp. TaxID=162156 RepID=UPI00280BE559|nr:IS1595 family transposase [uncultured Bacteroides sp.]
MKTFLSLLHMIDTLHTEEDCRQYLEDMRWGGEPVCPHCGSISKNHYKLTQNGKFKGLHKCKDCRERFTATQGTMFEGSHVPLKKWFYAIYLFLAHKKGISSVQLAKDIDVTQKTAWFMLSRIRVNLKDDDANFDDMTQVDETYVGGKGKKGQKNQGRSTKQKTPVMGLLSEGLVHARVVPNTTKKILQAIIDELVRPGSMIISDEWGGYNDVEKKYIHEVVKHKIHEYVNKKGFHTNSIEGFWSQLKRGIIGIYHLVSRKHLPKYCKEFVFRYNTRKMTDGERFNEFLGSSTERMYYGELLMKPEWIWESK